ncbi:unnamed protein product [Ixodes hexagonus]
MLAHSLVAHVDIFVVTEINVSDAGLDVFTLQGYHPHFVTRQLRRGGGITIFVRDIYAVSPRDISFAHAECLAVDNSVLVLFTLYRPPSNCVSRSLLELDEVLQHWETTDQICLVGDFNINTLCSTKVTGLFSSDYLSVVYLYGFEPAIHTLTREQLVNENLVKSCLGHISVRAPNISHRLADHYFVACRSSACPSPSVSRPSEGEVKHNTIKIPTIDQRKLDDLIIGFDWLTLIEHNTPEKVYEQIANN